VTGITKAQFRSDLTYIEAGDIPSRLLRAYAKSMAEGRAERVLVLPPGLGQRLWTSR
jgi:hypothetical protein